MHDENHLNNQLYRYLEILTSVNFHTRHPANRRQMGKNAIAVTIMKHRFDFDHTFMINRMTQK